jgi:chromosome partitioning protein
MIRKARIISIVNQKGGVGKTTSAINLSTTFALLGKKTLIIDLDPQGNASTGFGITDRSKSIYNVLIGEYSIQDTVFPTEIKNLSIITSTVDLSACEVELANFNKREFILKSKLEEISDQYDYIFIDCPPSLGLLTINALTAIHSILVPMQCEFFALEGLSHLLSTLELIKNNINPDLEISGIILAMHDKRNKLTEQVENDVRDFLGDIVYKTIIPRNIKMSEAPSYGIPGITYDKNCAGSKAYIKLGREILKREEAKIKQNQPQIEKNYATA